MTGDVKVWCSDCNNRVYRRNGFDCNSCCNNTVYIVGWGVFKVNDLDNFVNT